MVYVTIFGARETKKRTRMPRKKESGLESSLAGIGSGAEIWVLQCLPSAGLLCPRMEWTPDRDRDLPQNGVDARPGPRRVEWSGRPTGTATCGTLCKDQKTL